MATAPKRVADGLATMGTLYAVAPTANAATDAVSIGGRSLPLLLLLPTPRGDSHEVWGGALTSTCESRSEALDETRVSTLRLRYRSIATGSCRSYRSYRDGMILYSTVPPPTVTSR